MSTPAPGPGGAHLELLDVLAAHDVACVLVGGVAMQLYGVDHTTRDVDVVVAVDEPNRERIEAALIALDARPVASSERGSKFQTRLGPVELLRTTDGVGTYEGWAGLRAGRGSTEKHEKQGGQDGAHAADNPPARREFRTTGAQRWPAALRWLP